MKTSDPLSDLLTRLRNGMRAGHDRVDVPASTMKEAVLKVLEQEGYIASFRRVQEEGRPVLRVGLKYDGEGEPIVTGLERISRPGRRSTPARTRSRWFWAGWACPSSPRRRESLPTRRRASRVSAAKCSATSGEERTTVSRIGRMPVVIPKGVEVRTDARQVRVKGPKGELVSAIPEGLTVDIADGEVRINRGSDEPRSRASTACSGVSSPTTSRA